jgi:hypothetical protein
MDIFEESKKFLSKEKYTDFVSGSTEMGKLLWNMINNPDKFM